MANVGHLALVTIDGGSHMGSSAGKVAKYGQIDLLHGPIHFCAPAERSEIQPRR
jgi:hypothetical protein